MMAMFELWPLVLVPVHYGCQLTIAYIYGFHLFADRLTFSLTLLVLIVNLQHPQVESELSELVFAEEVGAVFLDH